MTEQLPDKQVGMENITAGRDIHANIRQKITKIRQNVHIQVNNYSQIKKASKPEYLANLVSESTGRNEEALPLPEPAPQVIASKETDYLLSSETMKWRLLEAR